MRLNLTEFEDSFMTSAIVNGLVDKIFELTEKLPTAIIVTDEQWKKHFYSANEKLTNFRGIPLESPERGDRATIVTRTINGILKGMHIKQATTVSEVYMLLENMKEQFGGNNV